MLWLDKCCIVNGDSLKNVTETKQSINNGFKVLQRLSIINRTPSLDTWYQSVSNNRLNIQDALRLEARTSVKYLSKIFKEWAHMVSIFSREEAQTAHSAAACRQGFEKMVTWVRGSIGSVEGARFGQLSKKLMCN